MAIDRLRPTGELARPTQSVLHAYAILRAFSPQEPALRVSEIARRVGLDRSSVSRLLQTMAEIGLVARDEQARTYRLGMALVELAGVALAGLDLVEIAQSEMRRLSAATRETINLAIWDRDEAVVVAHVPGLEPIRALGSVGRRLPAHCTSTGKALLAFADAATQERCLRQPLVAFTARTIANPVQMRRELEDIRRRGYATNRSEFQDGLDGVSAPVFNRAGEVCASLGVSGPAYRLAGARLDELGQAAVEAANVVSRNLGATRPSAAPS
jgi:DNA-binding IclR family transcriptional regulator